MKTIKASNYVPSKEQIKWYLFCVNNNIRISLNGIYNQPKKYRISIQLGPYKKGEKINYAPEIYDEYNVMPAYYNFCKYYYDKYENKV